MPIHGLPETFEALGSVIRVCGELAWTDNPHVPRMCGFDHIEYHVFGEQAICLQLWSPRWELEYHTVVCNKR